VRFGFSFRVLGDYRLGDIGKAGGMGAMADGQQQTPASSVLKQCTRPSKPASRNSRAKSWPDPLVLQLLSGEYKNNEFGTRVA